MDGWGHGKYPKASAITQANAPFVSSLYQKYPNTELTTHGEAVGLPDDQMGNSEVGHLNIGAGRIVYQELMRINKAIANKELYHNTTLLKAYDYAKKNNKPVHFIGLLSDGGVHSHINHLKALCDSAKENGLSDVFIHAFTDGRDCDPKSGAGFIEEMENHLKTSIGEIISVCGRYYAMDRDKRWQRIKSAYDLMVNGKGYETNNIVEAIQKSYTEGVTDEFIQPIIKKNHAQHFIKNGDVVICFNFRTDRCREITRVLTQEDFSELAMKKLNLYYVTMTVYDKTFQKVETIFDNKNLKMTLGEVLEKEGKKQLRIAETEKYPHVTFFFSGGREKEFTGEKRIMIPSPKVATYDLQPEMSAYEVKNKTVSELEKRTLDFVCLNFANADMVGHTGDFQAAIKAVETVDQCVKEVVETGLKNGYTILVTADHGNADYMINEDGTPNTAHTKNPVPLFLIGNGLEKLKLKSGKLADLSPTILTLMSIDIPEQMTGEVLI